MKTTGAWITRFAPLLLVGVAIAAPDDGKQLDIQFAKRASLSAPEMQAQAKEYRKQMQATIDNVVAHAATASKQKDLIKLNCLNDKRQQIQGYITVGDKALVALDEAVSKNDDGARQHEFARVTIVAQKVQTLGIEAENCVGEDLSEPGRQAVRLDIDPSIPVEDPTNKPTPSVEPVPRPPAASPSA